MRSRSLVIAVLLVASAAIGWWWKATRVADTAATSMRSSATSAVSESPRPDVLAAPEASVVETRAEAAPSAAAVTSPTPDAPLGADEAWLAITTVAKEDGHVLAKVRVYAHALAQRDWHADNVDGSEGGEMQSPRTGDDGVARVRVRAGLVYDVGAYLEAPPRSRAKQNVTALAAGETRAVRVELPTAADVAYFARVVAAADRSPIAGATITQLRGTRDSDGELVDEPLSRAPVVRSGSDGQFELRGESWAESAFRVEAAGFGRRLGALRSGHETPASAQAIELFRAASLHVTVLGAVGSETLSVTVTTPGYEIAQRETENDYFSSGSQRWRADVGADGRASFAKLPPNARLRTTLGAGKRILLQEAKELTLTPGEERTLELEVGLGATVAGTMQDDDGHPVADAQVWLLAREDSWNGFDRGQEPLRKATTDAQGAFELTEVGVGTWAVGLAPPERDATDASSALAGMPVEVVVAPSDRRVTVELRVTRGLSIAGRVVDREGNAIGGVFVTGSGPESGNFPTVRANAEGAFKIAPVTSGEWSLTSGGGGFDEWVRCDPLAVRAGDQNVVLVLDRGGAIAITAVDESGAPVKRGHLTWSASSDANVDGSGITSTGFGGDERIVKGLRPGAWDVVVAAMDGSIGVERVVVAVTKDPTPVKIRVHSGGSLVVRNSKGDTWTGFIVRCGGLRVSQGTASKDEVETLVVPADTLRIEWLSPTTNTITSRVVRVGVGQKLEVDLEDG